MLLLKSILNVVVPYDSDQIRSHRTARIGATYRRSWIRQKSSRLQLRTRLYRPFVGISTAFDNFDYEIV